MIIKIIRYRKKTATIDGQLYIEGIRICDTAENSLHAIPSGQYPVSIIKCKQHSRKMPIVLFHKDLTSDCAHCPELKNVSNNTSMPCKCCQLTPGNGVYNRTDGTIILGTFIAPGCLKHSKKAFDTIYERIRKNVERGNEVTLIIREQS